LFGFGVKDKTSTTNGEFCTRKNAQSALQRLYAGFCVHELQSEEKKLVGLVRKSADSLANSAINEAKYKTKGNACLLWSCKSEWLSH
jgi:hypothetical protein